MNNKNSQPVNKTIKAAFVFFFAVAFVSALIFGAVAKAQEYYGSGDYGSYGGYDTGSYSYGSGSYGDYGSGTAYGTGSYGDYNVYGTRSYGDYNAYGTGNYGDYNAYGTGSYGNYTSYPTYTYSTPTYTYETPIYTYETPTYANDVYSYPTYTYQPPIYTYTPPVYTPPPAIITTPPIVTPPPIIVQPPVYQTPILPTVHIVANPGTIASGNASVLSWNSSNATQCSASGAWSGEKALSGSETITPGTTATYQIFCTNGYGQASDQVTVYVQQQIPSVHITANPSTINQGNTSVLSWSSNNAAQCYATGGWSGQKSVSGSETVSPSVTTNYTIVCSNGSGQASDSATVSVIREQLPTVHLTASPSTISQGGTSVLSWTSSNAAQCSASGGWSGTKNLSGSENISPNFTATYTINCTNSAGQATDTATVYVTQSVPTVSLTANPTTISQGGSSVLSWNSSNATQCTASGGWSGWKPLSGSETVYPGINTTYTITCTNGYAQATDNASVYVQQVNQSTPTVHISSNPSVINSGSSSALSWYSSNATACTAGGGWSGTKGTSGSETVTPYTSTNYTITCYNNYGRAFDQTTVIVNYQQVLAPTVNITVNPGSINRGQSSILVWSSNNASTCYASGGWSGTKNLSGSETVTPQITTTYTINCSNSQGYATQSATVFVNNILPQPPITYAPFSAACVASPAVAQVGRTVSFVSGVANGYGPYTYRWSGDIVGFSEDQSFIFGSIGAKFAHLRVTDYRGAVAETDCSVQITPKTVVYNPPVTTPKPKPPVQPTATNYCETVCGPLGYKKVTAPSCQTYTVCDGQVVPGSGQGGPGDGSAPGTPYNPYQYQPGTGGTAINNSGSNSRSFFASLFLTEQGKPSRLAFLLIWYIIILILIAFVAMLWSALRRRNGY